MVIKQIKLIFTLYLILAVCPLLKYKSIKPLITPNKY